LPVRFNKDIDYTGSDDGPEVASALFLRMRNGEDIAVAPCFLMDPASSLPPELLDLPSVKLPAGTRPMGDACDVEYSSHALDNAFYPWLTLVQIHEIPMQLA
jgi:hypothetical protein